MNNSLPDTEEMVLQDTGKALLGAFHFWNRKRVLFNTLVGLSGGAAMILYMDTINFFDMLGVFMWGITANALYTLGYLADSYMIAAMKKMNGLGDYRLPLFWLGTIAYVIVSFVFCYLYYLIN